ncbi:MAG: DnaT-like ssDNA-binding domain-containing protein [Halioglobus sp.]|nr:DnaT-like ssDNA-binding domain-containing protein [Halioglobus sp.]
MSDFSLIPERQLLFSPLLAATIGLDEAIMLQHLQHLFEHLTPQTRNGYAWISVDSAFLLRTLPFWSPEDLHRISRSLADKGVLLIDSAPLHTATQLVFALNEPAKSSASPAPVEKAPLVPTRPSAGLLPPHWSPSEDLLQLMSMNHNIPRQFALDQLEDYIFYWRERGETSHAWENKFRQHIIAAWRRQQQHQAESFRIPPTTALDNSWRPSADAMEIMERAEIDREFIEQSVPEFILYWRERGAKPKELNSKFIQHIRIQWAKFTSSLEHSTEPKRIADHWQPSGDVFDILRLSHIDTKFAQSLVPEFIVYWRDSNQAQTSWNSKFIQHVKYHWAKRHQIEQAGQSNGGHKETSTAGRTRDRSLQQDLTDTSWAE